MPKYRVLYYPYFEPDLAWLRAILLFVDGVDRIIPAEARHREPEQVAALRETLSPDAPPPPGAENNVLGSFDPTHFDLSFGNDIDLRRMRKAFALIRDSIPPEVDLKLETDPLRKKILNVALHRSKIEEQILAALEEHHLIRYEPTAEEQPLAETGFFFVHESAVNLIMSYVANKIARSEGQDAITDQKLGFTVNALDNLRIPTMLPAGIGEGALISAVASCEIPADVGHLSLNAYKEIRESYAGIRQAFKKLIKQLAYENSLERIDNPETLQKKLTEIAQELVDEIAAYRQTSPGSTLKKWAPLGVGGLLGVATSAIGNLPLGVAVGKEVGSLVISIVDKKINQEPPDPARGHAYQMLCGLQKEIIDRNLTKSLLHLL